MRIYIGGNSGVGKTTIIRRFAEIYKEYKAFTATEIIFQAHGVRNKEELVKGGISLEKIKNEYKKYDNLITDGHFDWMEDLKEVFDAFIFVTADTTEVIERRRQDKNKKRPTVPYLVKKEERETVERAKDGKIKRIYVVKNKKNKLEEAIKEIEDIVDVVKNKTKKHLRLLKTLSETEFNHTPVSSMEC